MSNGMELRSLLGKIVRYVYITHFSSLYYTDLMTSARPRQICPITGRQAHYLDPRSGVPYADSHAYKVLTSLLRHEYVWNAALGCYLDHGEPPVEVLEREKRMIEAPADDDPMNVDDGD